MTEQGDGELCKELELYMKAVGSLLCPARSKNISTIRSALDVQALEESRLQELAAVGQQGTLLQGSTYLATFMPRSCALDNIDGYFDDDWSCDDFDRKSFSGGNLLSGGCRLHSHSRKTNQHALSSGESEMKVMSDFLKEAVQSGVVRVRPPNFFAY